MTRQFICAPADLDRFSKDSYAILSNNLDIWPNMPSMMKHQVAHRLKQLSSYGLKPDATTNEFVAKALFTFDMVDYHYAIHHIIWQMWDAARKNEVYVSRITMEWLNKVTEDCLE